MRDRERVVDAPASTEWFLAATFGLLGVAALLVAIGLLWRGHNGWTLLSSNDFEATAICTQNPSMDCNPRGWKTAVSIGAVALATSLSLLFMAVRALRPART